MAKVANATVHLQEDLLHDVFEVRGAAEHSLSQPRYVLPMCSEELPESLGIAALAAFNETGGIHGGDFTSDRPIWLARGYDEPHERRGWRIRQGGLELASCGQL